MIFRVCLFRGKIGRMENVREKMHLCVVWLGGGKTKKKKKNFVWDLGIFHPGPQKLLSKMQRKRCGLLCDKYTLTFLLLSPTPLTFPRLAQLICQVCPIFSG